MQRLTVYFSGRVQGVGFRVTCSRLAMDFDVTGRVCNLTDGRVEMIAEGERAVLISLRDRISIEMKRYIAEQHEQWSAPQKTWTNFQIAADK